MSIYVVTKVDINCSFLLNSQLPLILIPLNAASSLQAEGGEVGAVSLSHKIDPHGEATWPFFDLPHWYLMPL